MSYLNIGGLCWELKSLMKNNYGEEVTIKNFNKLFNKAKSDIISSIKDAIEDNRDTLKEDFGFSEVEE